MAGVHRGGLHVLLWQRQDATSASVRIVQKQLATELGVSKWSMSRILKTMAEEGRIRALPGSGATPTTYEVVDPKLWAQARSAGDAPS